MLAGVSESHGGLGFLGGFSSPFTTKEFGAARAPLRPTLDTAQAADPCGEIPSRDGKVRAGRKETTLSVNKRDSFSTQPARHPPILAHDKK